MAGMIVPTDVKQAAVSIVVTRADGTTEDLGIVSYYHRNPIQRLRYAVLKRLGRVDDTFFSPQTED